ncbi:MAG: hypothetical protein UW66_C0044G0007 [Candidatus Moranbacteria bacterium GW2011_GWF1_44_4]|nr:MAG: hypothetical protein UW66_C0044G0007 [Candidatus Moranbacteria bacterium GW2011_GWF1_44_4]
MFLWKLSFLFEAEFFYGIMTGMKLEKKIFEIVFHARGGQGAKTAAELLAQAALAEGTDRSADENIRAGFGRADTHARAGG